MTHLSNDSEGALKHHFESFLESVISVAIYKDVPRSEYKLVLVHLFMPSCQPIIFKLKLLVSKLWFQFHVTNPIDVIKYINLPCDYIWSAVSLWGLLSFLFDEYLWSPFELKNRISMSKTSKLKLIEALNEKTFRF